jgi:regulation of enolase protein 1 (concanavalin A-like superfamily)
MVKWASMVALAALVVGLAGCKTDPTNKGTVKGTGGKELSLTPPSDTTVKAGTETEKIAVRVGRTQFDEDVTISFDQLPTGVSIKEDDLKIAKGATSREFTVAVKADAPEVSGQAVKVTAKSGDMSVTREFKMNVKK